MARRRPLLDWVDSSRGPDACWPWLGRIDGCGYGSYTLNRKTNGAHRYVYEALVGPIPAGLQIDHLCRRRDCVNPAHLEPVTKQENIRRRDANRTHCSSGHPFNEENTYHWRGRKFCRACNRGHAKSYAARKRKEAAA